MATEIVQAGEIAQAKGVDEWTAKRIEFLYELAYLRVFVAWESLLEDIFLRTLCGYASRAAGREPLICGRHHQTLMAAETALLAGQRYVLWENSWKIINRCTGHIGTAASPGNQRVPGLQERIIASNSTRLDAFASIRHRIVHDQEDGRQKVDIATRLFAGRTYPASRPGKFLRDIERGTSPPRRWLDTAIGEFTGLASQMV